MRRAPIVLSATVAGLAAVLNFNAHKPALPTAIATSPGGATATPSPSATPSATRSGTRSGTTVGTRTADGDAIPTRYGNAQVRVTISGGRITKIEPLQLQANEPKSVVISTSAEPLLRQSALSKQSAAIDAVSGATITSGSYEASLQSALDKLGFKAADGSRGNSTVPNVQEGGGGFGG
jgi:uncharacterized protein with FMN-binding domain